MIYKIVIVFVFLFSIKTFSSEQQVTEQDASKDHLAKKQLEMIIESIKEDKNAKDEEDKVSDPSDLTIIY